MLQPTNDSCVPDDCVDLDEGGTDFIGTALKGPWAGVRHGRYVRTYAPHTTTFPRSFVSLHSRVFTQVSLRLLCCCEGAVQSCVRSVGRSLACLLVTRPPLAVWYSWQASPPLHKTPHVMLRVCVASFAFVRTYVQLLHTRLQLRRRTRRGLERVRLTYSALRRGCVSGVSRGLVLAARRVVYVRSLVRLFVCVRAYVHACAVPCSDMSVRGGVDVCCVAVLRPNRRVPPTPPFTHASYTNAHTHTHAHMRLPLPYYLPLRCTYFLLRCAHFTATNKPQTQLPLSDLSVCVLAHSCLYVNCNEHHQ